MDHSADAQLRQDARRLEEMLKIPVETLCKIGGEIENPFSLHGQLLPEPDGRGLGAGS